MPGSPATSLPRTNRLDRLPAVEAVRWFGMGVAALGPMAAGASVATMLLVAGGWADAWSPMGWAVRLGIGGVAATALGASILYGLQSARGWAGRFGRIRAAALVEACGVCHDGGGRTVRGRPAGWLVAATDLAGTIHGNSQSPAVRSAPHDGVATMLSIRANERGRAIPGRAIGVACFRLVQQRLLGPAALLALAGLSVALSPAVAWAGVDRLGAGAWREAGGGVAAESFSRWNIALQIDDASIRSAQRGGPMVASATVRDAGFGGLIGALGSRDRESRDVRTSVEIRPAPDERGRAGAPVVLPTTRDAHDAARFEASAAGRILSTLNSDRVQVRAAAYSPVSRALPSRVPRLGGTTTRPSNAGRPGWWRGVSEWRVVDLEPTPALERLWVRITGADGLLRGLYELDPQREGQRVPASAGDVVTIEVDASVRLWGMEVELLDHDAAMPELPVAVDSVFEEVERGAADRVAWRSYRICGHEGSEVGVGVRAIAQRRSGNEPGPDGARGLVSEISSPFSLLIAQAADWAETAQSAARDSAEGADQHGAGDAAGSGAGEAEPSASVGTGVVLRDQSAADAATAQVGASAAGGTAAPAAGVRPQAGVEPAGADASQGSARVTENSANSESNANGAGNNERGTPGGSPSGSGARPTGEPQLGGDPEPGTSGQTTRRGPETDPPAEPELPGPAPRVGGGDEPALVQSVALLRARGMARPLSIGSGDADQLIVIFGLDAVSPEDRAIALAYRRMLIGEASKAGRDGARGEADARKTSP